MSQQNDPIPDGYSLIRALPEGAIGVVYLVNNATTGAIQVIKRLKDKALQREDMVVRFFREITGLQIAQHSHIIKIDAAGQDDLGAWYAMEYCEGGDLEQFYRERGGQISTSEAMTIADQILAALEFLHDLELPGLAASHRPARGIVHRDVKPANIFLTTREPLHVKLADFSFAKSLALLNAKGITKSRAAGGTLRYAPRDNLKDFRDLKPAADLWSAMATIFFLLTGQPPREFSQLVRDDQAVRTRPARAIEGLRVDLPKPIARVIDDTLREDGKPAYNAAHQLREDLRVAALESGLRLRPDGQFEE